MDERSQMIPYKILPKIKHSSDVKSLSTIEIMKLSSEIRSLIIETVSKNGGHLASNLGVVELSIALHLAFDFPRDQLVFDVSHQSYAHKLLSGRFDQFATLRTYKGLSGYCKITESEYDAFGAGHASTSISAALGLKIANDLNGIVNHVIAVIGDGALTGGMAFEALNSLGNMQRKLITIINDNEQSISKNVGALSSILNNLRTSKKYTQMKVDFRNTIPKIPVVGTSIKNFVSRTKNMLKHELVEGMFFEELGLTYIGIIDGHDIAQMKTIFEAIKEFDSPVVLHVITKKGKGYLPASKNPCIYHGVGKFDYHKGIEEVEEKDSASLSYSDVFGKKLVELAAKDDQLVAITAAMDQGTRLEYFKEAYKERFFDVGIAEANAMTLSAGMARNGLKPYFAVYSTFLQRAYDQLIHDVCLQKLPVRICLDRCGLVGEDGPTHHGVFDMQMLLAIPNLELLSPYSKEDLEYCLEYSLQAETPLCIRYPRGKAISSAMRPSLEAQGESVKTQVTVFAYGTFFPLAERVSDALNALGISAKTVKLLRLKPLDSKHIAELSLGSEWIVSIEDGQQICGFSSYLRTVLQAGGNRFQYLSFGYPDRFVEHGSIAELHQALGFEAEKIAASIQETVRAQ